MKRILLTLTAATFLQFHAISQNVGVDVATPAQKLDVAGGLRIGNTSNAVAGSIRWNSPNFQVYNGSQWITFGAGTDNDWATTGNDLYSQPSGNVGIGTTTPATKLEVAGTARVSELDVNGNYTLPTTDGGVGFVLTTDGSGNVVWSNPALVGDITSVVAGAGLINGGISGDVTLDVNPGDGIIITSDEVRVNANDLEGDGLSVTANNFDINTDGSTIETNADALRVVAEGITANEIATGAVTTDEILNNTIAAADIATGAVATDEILDGTILPADVSSGGNDMVLTTDGSGTVQWQTQGSLSASQQGDGLVYDGVNAEIDVNVDNSTLEVASDVVRVAAEGITANEIATGAVTTNEILDNTISTSDILNNTIIAADIATGGVASDEILDGSILPADVSSGGNDMVLTTDGSGTVQWQTQSSLTADHDGDGLLYNGGTTEIDVNVDNSTLEIASDVVRVAAEGITANEIATGAVTTDEILNNTIIAADIATGGVATDEILNNTIIAADIATGAVTTDEILNGTILGADIDPSATVNQVLATTVANTTVAWVDPATLTTVLQDGDADTRITVEVAGNDEDDIRMWTNGTERLTIDNTGNVGIGIPATATIDRNLHVADATGGKILAAREDVTTTAGETLGELHFDSRADTEASSVDASALIRGIAAQNQGNSDKGGHLAFLTKANSTNSNGTATEHLRITQAGNIGIGTTTPTEKLNVIGDIKVSGSGSTIGGVNINNAWLTIGDDASSGVGIDNNEFYFKGIEGNFGTIGSYGLRVNTNSSTRMFVSSIGRVGIGTIAPDQRLDVNGQVRITTGASRAEGMLLSAGGASGNAWSRIFMEENGSNTYGFSIVYNGGAANTVLNYPTNTFGITRHNNSTNGVIALAIDRATGATTIANLAGSGNRVVQANANGVLSTTSSLVGTGLGDNLGNHTATTTLNMANFNVNAANHLRFNDPGDQEGILWSGTAAKIFVSPFNSGNSDGYLRLINDGGIVFEPGGEDTERVTFLANGNVGIGTTAPGSRLHVANTSGSVWTWSSLQNLVSLQLGQNNTGNVGSIRLNSYSTNSFVFLRPSNGNYHIDASTGQFYYNWDESVRGSSNGAIHIANQGGTEQVRLQTAGSSWLNGGNVGFGTQSPAQRIHTTGNVRADARNYYFGASQRLYGDNGSQLNWYSNHSTLTQLIMRDLQGTIYGRVYGDNNGGSFGLLDRDGAWGIRIATDSYVELRDNNSVTFRAGLGGVEGNYGTVQTYNGGKGGWEGYSINGRSVFMNDGGNATGIYNDVDNEWMFYGLRNSYTRMYFNGSPRVETSSAGTTILGTIRITGGGPQVGSVLTATSTNGTATWSATPVGTTYVNWGRRDCGNGSTSSSTSIVYAGYAGGAHLSHVGSGANTICMTSSPNHNTPGIDQTNTGNQNGGLIYGVEFATSGYGIANYGTRSAGQMHGNNGGCAVCHVRGHSSMIMIPGTWVCPSTWTSQYWGYIMSNHYTNANRSDFLCVNGNPQELGSGSFQNGSRWYPVEKESGSEGSGYQTNREIVCVVCTK